MRYSFAISDRRIKNSRAAIFIEWKVINYFVDTIKPMSIINVSHLNLSVKTIIN
jgi:hypothetical protein